jgi:hypothetical protein
MPTEPLLLNKKAPTPFQRRALEFLRSNPGCSASELAEHLKPDSKMHLKCSNQGHGACQGKATWLWGGSVAGKLRRFGWVEINYGSSGSSSRTKYRLTSEGLAAISKWKTCALDGMEHYDHALKGTHCIGRFNPQTNPLLAKKYGGKGLNFKAVMAYTDKDNVIRFVFEAFKTKEEAMRFVEKRSDKLVADGAVVWAKGERDAN